MQRKLTQRLRTVPIGLFAGISVLLSEILTSAMSLLLQGRVTYDYLVTGGLVSLVVSAIVVYFIRQVSLLADHNEILQREVTHREKAEEALRESERKYRDIIKNMTDGYYRTDPGGLITLANPSLATLFGYDGVDEMIANR